MVLTVEKVRNWLLLTALVIGGLVTSVKVVIWADDLLEVIQANTTATKEHTRAIQQHHPEYRPEGVPGVAEKP